MEPSLWVLLLTLPLPSCAAIGKPLHSTNLSVKTDVSQHTSHKDEALLNAGNEASAPKVLVEGNVTKWHHTTQE